MTITKTPVTLTVEETERLCRILSDMARMDFKHASATKNAVVRQFSLERGTWVRDFEAKLVRRLYVQSA